MMNLKTKTHSVEQLEYIEEVLTDWFLGRTKTKELEGKLGIEMSVFGDLISQKLKYDNFKGDEKEAILREEILRGNIGYDVVLISNYILKN